MNVCIYQKNNAGRTPFLEASFRCNNPAVKWLLSYVSSFEPNSKICCDDCKKVMDVGTLLADRDLEGNTALHHAVQKGDAIMVSLLLKNNHPTNVANFKNQLPIDVLCYTGGTIYRLLNEAKTPAKKIDNNEARCNLL
eukprot:TRINITY_DN1207_c0_g2_i1.p1 TRINITY_DN1207_c0_g2~~TRINITY_DN1207_c0_g2_i1.p1  ORF type:complete len:138 (+),score=14.31 TRINITY_DN1207_c0_g2_i1:86-499(+)